MNLSNGHLLQSGKYKLTQSIGQGGFGITYKGIWHTEVKGSLGKVKTEVPICIKEYFFKDYCSRNPITNEVMVHSETGKVLFDKFKEKLIKEARILSDVHHPYIVNVLEVFEENNTAYIAMEYLSGRSLKQLMDRQGKLSEERTLKYIYQIGTALQFVHEKNILHLDIKPSNILIDKNDNARLIDFGVSKRYDDIEQQETSTTMLTLSKGFASIEQYDGEGMVNFSPRPDIYSLGATMFNLLTGKIPVESILRATKPLENPREINPQISSKTEEVILKAMQVAPDQRYTTVSELLEALDYTFDETAWQSGNHTSDNEEDEDDDTLLLTGKSGNSSGTDETTVANDPDTSTDFYKKKQKGLLIPFLVFMFGVLATAGFLLVYNNMTTQTMSAQNPEAVASSETPIITPEEEGDNQLEEPTEDEQTAETQTAENENKNRDIASPARDAVASNPNPLIAQTVESSPIAVTTGEEKNREEEEARNAAFEELLNSGKRKIEIADYTGAKLDLEAARDMKVTEELVHIMIDLDNKIEVKLIAERRNLYEERMAFGNLTIVKKKSTDRYGAIDSKANEIIPCNYIYTAIADQGRSFEREDGLWDIYNEKGDLVSERSTSYW